MPYDTTILEHISILLGLAKRTGKTPTTIYLGEAEYRKLRNARSDRLRLVHLSLQPGREAETFLDEMPVYMVNVLHYMAVG